MKPDEISFSGSPLFAVADGQDKNLGPTIIFEFNPRRLASLKPSVFSENPMLGAIAFVDEECQELGVDRKKLTDLLSSKLRQLALAFRNALEKDTGIQW